MSRQVERALIRDYILEKYPDKRVIFGCPLGPAPEKLIATWGAAKALRVARGLRPEVDAVVFEDHTLVLVEAKVTAWMDGLSKLPVYSGLVDTTPELVEYVSWERRMVLCLPYPNESVYESAKVLGVVVDSFTTPEVDEAIRDREKYWTPEWKHRQAEVKRVRALLGLE